VQTLIVRVLDQDWKLVRPDDLESYWERLSYELASGDDLPYWLEVWPSAKLLAELILKSKTKLSQKIGLDLGCGLGLVSLVAAEVGAKMLAMDYLPQILKFARKSAQLNNREGIFHLVGNWQHPPFQGQSLDFVLASDIFYERRFFEPLNTFFVHVLKPDGFIWLSNPLRDVSKDSIDFLRQKGWRVRQLAEDKVHLHNQSPVVSVFELQLSK